MNVLIDTSTWSLALRRKAHELNPAEGAVVGEVSNLVKRRATPGRSR